MSEKLSPERAVRLLRAKAGELEGYVQAGYRAVDRGPHLSAEIGGTVQVIDLANLAADIALVAALLADHIEQSPGPWGPEDEDWGKDGQSLLDPGIEVENE